MNRIWNSSVALAFVLALSTGLIAQPVIAAPQIPVEQTDDEEGDESEETEDAEEAIEPAAGVSWQTKLITGGVVIFVAYVANQIMNARARNQNAGGPVQRLAAAGAGVVHVAHNAINGNGGAPVVAQPVVTNGGGVSPRTPPPPSPRALPRTPPSKFAGVAGDAPSASKVNIFGELGLLPEEGSSWIQGLEEEEPEAVVKQEPVNEAAHGAGVVVEAYELFGDDWAESDEERPKSPARPKSPVRAASPAQQFLDFLPEVDPNAEDDEEFPSWMTPILPGVNEDNDRPNHNGPREEPPVEFTPVQGATPHTGLRNHSFRVVVGPRDSMEFVRRVNSQGEMDVAEEEVPADAEAPARVEVGTQFDLEEQDSIRTYIEALFNSPLAAQGHEIDPALHGAEVVIAIEDDLELEREVIEMLRTPDARGARLELVAEPAADLQTREPVIVVTMDVETVEVAAAPAPAQNDAPVTRTARKTARKPTRGDLEIIRQTGLTTAKRTRGGAKDKGDLAEVSKNLFN